MQTQFDQQKTQVQAPVDAVQTPTTKLYDDLMGKTYVAPARKRLLDGISIAQVIAAAAAAATSMMLASKIGIAGSVIGAAVSSVVTVVCSQLYRNALDASAEKLRQRQDVGDYPSASPATDLHAEVAARYGNLPTALENEGAVRPGARVAPTKLRARAAAQRSANARKVALASVGIAVLAVALCAGAILLSTSGAGLGSTVSLLPAAPHQTDGQNSSNDDGDANGTGAGATGNTDNGSVGAADQEGATSPEGSGQNGATGSGAGADSSEGAGGGAGNTTGDGSNSGTDNSGSTGDQGGDTTPSTPTDPGTDSGGSGGSGSAGTGAGSDANTETSANAASGASATAE